MAGMNITISEQETQEIRKAAKRIQLTPEEFAQKLIQNFIFRQKLIKIQKVGAKIAERLGIKTEEDVTRMFDKH